MSVLNQLSLLSIARGKDAIIVQINGGFGLRKKLSYLNLREGKVVRKITSQLINGPIIIRIDNRGISIGRGIASKIFAEVK